MILILPALSPRIKYYLILTYGSSNNIISILSHFSSKSLAQNHYLLSFKETILSIHSPKGNELQPHKIILGFILALQN